MIRLKDKSHSPNGFYDMYMCNYQIPFCIIIKNLLLDYIFFILLTYMSYFILIRCYLLWKCSKSDLGQHTKPELSQSNCQWRPYVFWCQMIRLLVDVLWFQLLINRSMCIYFNRCFASVPISLAIKSIFLGPWVSSKEVHSLSFIPHHFKFLV